MTPRWYVGCDVRSRKFVAFPSQIVPTEETHGHWLAYAIGPFRTKRGALFMAEHGEGNPHCVTVTQAEKLAKQSEPKGLR